MKVLVIHPGPDFSVHDLDVHAGWCEALTELGCQVFEYNLNDRLIFYSMAMIDTGEEDETGHPIVRTAMNQEQAWRAAMQGLSHEVLDKEPDVVLFISAFFASKLSLGILRKTKLRPKVVIIHTECPYEDTKQVMRAAYAHLNLVNDEASLEQFSRLGPCAYLPHSFRPRVHFPRTGPVDPALASDFIFVGSAFDSRKKFFESMDLTGIDVLIGGADWGSVSADSPLAKFIGTDPGAPDCVDNAQTAALYRNSKTSLNLYRREAEDGALQGVSMGPREVELAACGLFFLRDPRPESDEMFGKILPSFSSPEDASEQLRWWLSHPVERQNAADKARLAIADRTFVHQARRVLKMIENL